jgi:hypothetical protein
MLTITGLRETAERKGFTLVNAVTSGCWRLVDKETGHAVMNKRSGPAFTPEEAAKYFAVLPDKQRPRGGSLPRA